MLGWEEPQRLIQNTIEGLHLSSDIGGYLRRKKEGWWGKVCLAPQPNFE